MRTITTKAGETWDMISKRIYGNELFMHELIFANLSHRNTVIFEHGVELNAPEIDTESKQYILNVAPWERD